MGSDDFSRTGTLHGSVAALAATLAETLHVRARLFALEMREEMDWRRSNLMLALLAAMFLHAALLAGTALLVVLFWDTHRVTAIAAALLAYFALGLLLAWVVRVRKARRPAPFRASLGELREDFANFGRSS